MAISEIEVDDSQPADGQFAAQLLPPSSIDAWASVVCAVARTGWYAGFLVLPAVLVGIGLSQDDLLHSAYLLIVTVYFLVPAVTFQLDSSTASIGNEQVRPLARSCVKCSVLTYCLPLLRILTHNASWLQHSFGRTYASLHLTAMYVAKVACNPSLNIAHFPDEKALRVAGLICPSVPRSMLPVFLGLVLVSYQDQAA